MSVYRTQLDAAHFNRVSTGRLPGLLGIQVLTLGQGFIECEFEVRPELYAGNGFLHAGSIVTLADTAAGYGCVAHLPEGAGGFTTVELKSNHLATARDGHVTARGIALHLGRTTQVWDATVKHRETDRTIALFRCTQMVLWPK